MLLIFFNLYRMRQCLVQRVQGVHKQRRTKPIKICGTWRSYYGAIQSDNYQWTFYCHGKCPNRPVGLWGFARPRTTDRLCLQLLPRGQHLYRSAQKQEFQFQWEHGDGVPTCLPNRRFLWYTVITLQKITKIKHFLKQSNFIF